VNAIVFLSILINNLCAFIYYKGSKFVFDIREMLLALGDSFVAKGSTHFDREILSWVCDKLGFGGSFVVVIILLKENGK
jgi:hypothetical protein